MSYCYSLRDYATERVDDILPKVCDSDQEMLAASLEIALNKAAVAWWSETKKRHEKGEFTDREF